jgi:hypothetical protein
VNFVSPQLSKAITSRVRKRDGTIEFKATRVKFSLPSSEPER